MSRSVIDETGVMIQLNEPKREYIEFRRAIDHNLDRVLQSGWYVHGSFHAEFERLFAAYVGVDHVVGVANGTDALELALRAVGCRRGDEVITAANAGFYASAAALAIGCVPVYVDVHPATLTIDPEAVALALTERTAAVVVTHLYGKLAAVEQIVALADEVPVVEDCAQAHGAQRGGRRAGSFGAAGCFSFYPTKNLGAVGDGGAITTGDPRVADLLRFMRQYGWRERYTVEVPNGRNSRLDELQAAVLLAKLPRLDELNERRRKVVNAYRQAVGPGVSVVHEPGADYVAHLCIVRAADHKALQGSLEVRNVATAVHYPVLDSDQPIMAGIAHMTHDLRHSRMAVREILTIPCHPLMTGSEIERVCEGIAC